MRNIVHKISTLRTATAEGFVRLGPKTLEALRSNTLPKGDPFPVAKVAAIQAAKETPRLIPYCHSVPLEAADIEFSQADNLIKITATVSAIYKTGVEMEALTAVTAAALNLYDMMKAVDEEMVIEGVRLVEKRGGKSDFLRSAPIDAHVLVVSDRVSAGQSEDRSGHCIIEGLRQWEVTADLEVVPDEVEAIRAAVKSALEGGKRLVIVTGGTGVSPRDVTPEAILPMLEKRLEGVEEAIRAYGQERTPYAMFSRAIAGTIGTSAVLCLPGSPAGAAEGISAVFPAFFHVFQVLEGKGHSECQ